jgi:hypothetical protein
MKKYARAGELFLLRHRPRDGSDCLLVELAFSPYPNTRRSRQFIQSLSTPPIQLARFRDLVVGTSAENLELYPQMKVNQDDGQRIAQIFFIAVFHFRKEQSNVVFEGCARHLCNFVIMDGYSTPKSSISEYRAVLGSLQRLTTPVCN